MIVKILFNLMNSIGAKILRIKIMSFFLLHSVKSETNKTTLSQRSTFNNLFVNLEFSSTNIYIHILETIMKYPDCKHVETIRILLNSRAQSTS